MIPVWLIRYAPQIAITLILVGLICWVADMRNSLVRSEASVKELQISSQIDRAARIRDTNALTNLIAGIAAAAITTKHDNAILTETIDAKAPAASSPALANFMRCLAASDSNADTSGCINGTVAAPASGAVSK
jgi:hypothetical protein